MRKPRPAPPRLPDVMPEGRDFMLTLTSALTTLATCRGLQVSVLEMRMREACHGGQDRDLTIIFMERKARASAWAWLKNEIGGGA